MAKPFNANSSATTSVTPHIPGGFTCPKQLRQIAAIAEKYNGTVKIVGNSITINGLSRLDAEQAVMELGCKQESFIGQSVRAVVLCPGKPVCPRAQQDSTALGLELDAQFFGRPVPGKLRIGVSGCPNCCAEPMVKDIGLYGLPNGYILAVGGNSGRMAKAGTLVAERVPGDMVPGLIERILAWYDQHGREKERLGATVERLGLEQFIDMVIPSQFRIIK